MLHKHGGTSVSNGFPTTKFTELGNSVQEPKLYHVFLLYDSTSLHFSVVIDCQTQSYPLRMIVVCYLEVQGYMFASLNTSIESDFAYASSAMNVLH